MIEEHENKPIEWQSLAIGLFVGFILTLVLVWYINRDKHPEDWCNNLSISDAKYCSDLYWKSVDRQKNFQEK